MRNQNFLQKHWPELLTAAIVIALFLTLTFVAPYWVAGLAMDWTIVMTIASFVFGAFAYGITDGIRNRNEPDWPWFQRVTESPVPLNADIEIDVESPEINTDPISVTRVFTETELETLPLLTTGPINVAAASIIEQSPNITRDVIASLPRENSLQARIDSLEARKRADSATLTYKHEQASTTILLTKIKEAGNLTGQQAKSAAKRGEITQEFVLDMNTYCNNPQQKPLTAWFIEKPSHKTICNKNNLLNEKQDDLKEDVKGVFLAAGM